MKKREKNRNGGGKEKMGKETLRWRIGITGVIYGAAQHQRRHTGGILTAAKIEIPVGYHTIPYVPNQTQCSVSTRIQGSFFFFLLAANWNLITRTLLPFSICSMRVITLS